MEAEHDGFELANNTSYLTHTGELWDVYCEHLEKKDCILIVSYSTPQDVMNCSMNGLKTHFLEI